MQRSLWLMLAGVVMFVGSGCRQDSPASADHRPGGSAGTVVRQPAPSKPTSPEGAAARPEGPPGTATYNTGDSDVWPSIEMPLVITVEVPEVPEGIEGPSPPIPPEEE